MANNEQNLRPVRTKEEARERGAKGGKASGKARREKKLLKEALATGLMIALSGKDVEELDGMDFAEALQNPALSMQDKIAVAMIAEAANGNVQAAAFIRDTLGEKPAEKVSVTADIEAAKKGVADIVERLRGES